MKKAGILSKFRDGIISSWHTRYAVLTNGGLVQFEQKDFDKGKLEDLEAANFKPLHDFVVIEVSEQVSKKPNCFKVIFAKEGHVLKEMTLSAPTNQDRSDWMRAFRQHQIDMFDARGRAFERKLATFGVGIPNSSGHNYSSFNMSSYHPTPAQTPAHSTRGTYESTHQGTPASRRMMD